MFLEKVTPCYEEPEGNQVECLAGIPADAPTGRKRVSFFRNGEIFDLKEVEILPTSYPTEPLHLSEETKSLLSKKGREKEVKKIRKAMELSTLTKEKFWDENPQIPLEGKMESPYGERRILDGVLRPGFHRGVDIGAAPGTAILAMQDGKVLLAEEFSQEGKMILLNHGQGLTSAYLHCSEISVSKNQKVKKGEILGKVGSTGVSNSPHLHFGVYIHGIPVDPIHFLLK